MNYVIVALVFVVLVMLYIGYSYATNTALIKNAVYLPDTPANGLETIAWDKLDGPGSTTYNYQGWLYLRQKLNQSEKIPVIFYRGDEGIATNTQFILAIDGQSLGIYSNSEVKLGEMTTPGNLIMTIMRDIPVQKWMHFVINVMNGTIIECYINGKLVKSMQAPAPPANGVKLIDLTPDTRSSLKVGGTNSVKGYITKFKRDAISLTAEEAWNTYLEGNGLANYTDLTGGYGASFSLFTNAGVIKKVNIV